jgi:hypothetical protein
VLHSLCDTMVTPYVCVEVSVGVGARACVKMAACVHCALYKQVAGSQ